MNRLSIMFSLISIITLLTLTVNATESNMMPGHPGFPDDFFGNNGHHHSNFKIADFSNSR